MKIILRSECRLQSVCGVVEETSYSIKRSTLIEDGKAAQMKYLVRINTINTDRHSQLYKTPQQLQLTTNSATYT